jgi:hypothetical protein
VPFLLYLAATLKDKDLPIFVFFFARISLSADAKSAGV